MAFGLDNIYVGEYIQKAVDTVEYREGAAIDLNLGPWELPVTTFLWRYQELLKNSPQYTPEEAAAVVYFGMVAQQPNPTMDYVHYAIDWQKVDAINYGSDFLAYFPDYENYGPNYTNAVFENYVRFGTWAKKKSDKGKVWIGCHDDNIFYGWEPVLIERSLKLSYVESVYHLNKYLWYNGLYGGIEKTLAEESRKAQGIRAKALASQAAAAKALALSRASEDISQETIEKYEKQLAEAQAREEEINEYLKKLSNTPTGTGDMGGGSSGVAAVAIAALSFLAFRG